MLHRVSRHSGRIKIGFVVAGCAEQAARRAHAALAANDQGLMRSHLVCLRRAFGRWMTVQATRRLNNFSGFLEKRDGALVLVRNLVEIGDKLQRHRICRRLCLSIGPAAKFELCKRKQARCETARCERHNAVPEQTHTDPPRRTGNCRGRPTPNFAIALATAGPIGGTPGSPTPDGFSVDATIVTSTSGISSMRSER